MVPRTAPEMHTMCSENPQGTCTFDTDFLKFNTSAVSEERVLLLRPIILDNILRPRTSLGIAFPLRHFSR